MSKTTKVKELPPPDGPESDEEYNALTLDEKLEQDWKLAFKHPITEARYVEHTFRPAGLWFPAITLSIIGFIMVSATAMNFQADVLNDSIGDFFFSNASWQRDGTEPVRYMFYILGAICVMLGGAQIAYALSGRGASVPGWVLERLWILCVNCQLATHVMADFRYQEWCRPNEFSLLMRHPKKVDDCGDYIDAYLILTQLASFVLPTRLISWGPAMIAYVPFPFFYRKQVMQFNADQLFRTSDAVWIPLIFIIFLAMVGMERMNRRLYIQRAIVDHEGLEVARAKRAVGNLLNAMLPPSVLARVVKGEEISDSAVVTTVFSDVAGFTSWCSMRKANDVVEMLNSMYTLMDNGLKRFKIEKIKTIGDAYWAISGLPDLNPNHAMHICAFSRFMLSCVEQMGIENSKHKVNIRIGVHTGHVCAGLVGLQQSTYDVFGRANEVAERMEQLAPVGGVLLSEPTRAELIRHGLIEEGGLAGSTEQHSADLCKLSKQDDEVATAEGPLATYVLDSFDWIPPCSATEETVSAMTEEENVDSIEIIDGDAADETQSDKQAAAIESPKFDAAAPKTEKEEVTSPAADQKANATDSSEATLDLDAYREKISRASGKFLHNFDDEALEHECTEYIWQQFPQKLRIMSTMMAILTLVLYLVQVSTTTGNAAAVHVLMILNIFFEGFLFLAADKLHPYVGLAAYYIGCQILLAGLAVAEPSVVSVDLLYLSFTYLIFSPAIGFIGGYTYIIQCGLNVVLLFVPQGAVQMHYKTLYIHYVIAPGLSVFAWVVGLRRSEMDMRKLFIDKKVQDFALQKTTEEHEKVSELLARMVPQFIVDDLTVWFCGPRKTQLAVNFPLVGILFFRVPSFEEHFHKLSASEVMQKISAYVSTADQVLLAYSKNCTKLKIIGDILLVGSGLDQHQKLALKQLQAGARSAQREARMEKIKEMKAEHQQHQQNNNGVAIGASPLESASPSYASDVSSTYSQDQYVTDSPLGKNEHLHKLALCALTLMEAVERETKCPIRAGMHCGPATSGIIGNDRLVYDVFGDTVNTASRVMSTAAKEGVWASKHFTSSLSEWPSMFFGDETERQMKGKGKLVVYPVLSSVDKESDVSDGEQ